MQPSMKIPFLQPPLGQEEIDAAVAVLTTSSLTAGDQTEMFEAEFAQYIGTRFAVAVNSGTSALDLIFKTLILKGMLKPGDGVIVPSFTFVACANVLVNNGLVPVFVDIYESDLNMRISEFAIPEGVRGILAVHTFGRPANLTSIKHIADKHNLIIVEDCAESIGADYACHKVGSFGHAAAFSFIATKNMTCCEGGMITTDNWETAMIAEDLRAHGIMKGRHLSGTNVNYQDVVQPGYNLRMTEVQAAIGRVQLKHLDGKNFARRHNTNVLNGQLRDISWLLTLFPLDNAKTVAAPSMFSFLIPRGHIAESRDEVVRRICHAGVDARIYFSTPIHKYTYYRQKFQQKDLPITTDICSRIISLPIYPSLSPDDLDLMADAVRGACR